MCDTALKREISCMAYAYGHEDEVVNQPIISNIVKGFNEQKRGFIEAFNNSSRKIIFTLLKDEQIISRVRRKSEAEVFEFK